ncbi:MAG: FAD:protein FMN transferase [Gammaproteobacteria bacterium]|nr:MAG: FAD:protein FMN transferase [Gammaproteobacteria bacterium]
MEISFRLIILVQIILAVFPVQAEWFQESQNKMGTRVFIKLWHEDATVAHRLLLDAMAEFDRIEAVMSTYRADSEISRINANGAIDWVPVGEELYDLITRALALSVQTDGAFDITYDSVGQFYDFRKQVRPSELQLEEGLPAINYRHLLHNPETFEIRFAHPGVRINLGGIAKGYAVESAIRLLEDAGVHHALANAGGDTRVLGDRVGKPWIVGIRDPDDELKFVTRLALNDSAISTSGDYEQFFMEGSIRYHHIMSPSTGDSATGVRSVTITGPSATITDGLSTSVFVMGPEAGLRLLESFPSYDGIIIDQQHHIHYSTGVSPL